MESASVAFNLMVLCYITTGQQISTEYCLHQNTSSYVEKNKLKLYFESNSSNEFLKNKNSHFTNFHLLTEIDGKTKSRKCQKVSRESDIVNLVNYIADKYLHDCTTVILYDSVYEKKQELMNALFTSYTHTYMQAKLEASHNLTNKQIKTCSNLILLLKDLRTVKEVENTGVRRLLIITQVSKRKVEEFLNSALFDLPENLLVIRVDEESNNNEFVLYTHDLFTDGLGSSSLRVLTTWRCGALTRPDVNLFAPKLLSGFSGHQFTVATGHQPPFVIKRGYYFDGPKRIPMWDGLEIRLLQLISELLNFTMSFEEPEGALSLPLAPGAVVEQVRQRKADIGVGGVYVTKEWRQNITMSYAHTQDCVTFMTVASTALPRYRAIMGPFHWTVWLALTLTYLLAIFPISFSHNHSLKHLLKNPWEMENMFWYVFGTFTNCFTFKGENSWAKAEKSATRMFIGLYWIFSIIVAACYTGSIIAFVTLPVYPAHVDNLYEIYHQGYKVGTLSEGGWRHWFNDSADPIVDKIYKKIEFLPDLESAMYNVTTSYFRNYAFLGSQALLDHTIRTNYTKRAETKSYLHLGKNCFVPFGVAIVFPPGALHSRIMNHMILRAIQSGLIKKLNNDLVWDLQRTSSGKHLAVVSGSMMKAKAQERKLTLEDVQGMFLLLGAGFGIATFVLAVETIAWIVKIVKKWCRTGTQKTKYSDNTERTSKMGNDEIVSSTYRTSPPAVNNDRAANSSCEKQHKDTDLAKHSCYTFQSMLCLPRRENSENFTRSCSF